MSLGHLNPIEKFWARLRNMLRQMDLEDLRRGRRPVNKAGLQWRVRTLCRTKRAQRVVVACMQGIRRVAREVLFKKGSATRG